MNAAEFNALYEIGVPVFAYPGARPEDIPSARRLVTRTRSKAQPAGLDREGVVWVDGHGAYIALTHVDVVSEEAWEAARAAQRVAAMNDDVTSRDTLPAWLYQRFAVIHGCPPWDTLGDDERAYWVHQAAAVQRAVARGGFKTDDADDRRRRIYVDGKGDGWIDLSIDPESGERDLTGITNPWKIASADEVRNDTGGLTEIGRCW